MTVESLFRKIIVKMYVCYEANSGTSPTCDSRGRSCCLYRLSLVATCDIAVASEEASFGVNGVDIGLFCSAMVALLETLLEKAFEMLTTGDFLDPFQAEKLGLINKVTRVKISVLVLSE